MSDTGNTTPPAGQQAPPTPGQPTPEQLAALAPFQSQLTWVGSQEHARGRQEGARELTEQLGMPVAEAVAKLKALGTQGQPSDTGQQSQGQAQPPAQQTSPDLERRMADLEARTQQLTERETQLNEREATLKAGEQDGLRISALEELGMTKAQAQVAKGMMPLPTGVTELTPELAKASAEQLKTTFPGLFPTGDGGDEQKQPGAGTGTNGQTRTPADTTSRGTQTAGSSGGSGQSADERARARLVARKHVKPAAG